MFEMGEHECSPRNLGDLAGADGDVLEGAPALSEQGEAATVKKGSTMKWVWKGSAQHDVTVTSGPAKFHSATQTKGSFSKKLTKKGTYKLVCTVHAPSMSMKIKVR